MMQHRQLCECILSPLITLAFGALIPLNDLIKSQDVDGKDSDSWTSKDERMGRVTFITPVGEE
jgi:hypothetical protein